MTMMLTRRDALTMGTATAISALAPFSASAQAARPVRINLLGFALGIHMPTTAAVLDLLPPMGYAPATQRMDQIRTLTQTLVAGAAELGETDSMTVMRAVESGADLKIVGLWHTSTSLVFVVNADKIREFKDLEKPDSVVAVNGVGDITHVLLVGPLLQRGVDLKKVNVIEVGGSGARMRALLAGRVHAVPMHFDQAAEAAKQGNFKVLIEPWKEYKFWVHEVWACAGSWLKKKENERTVIDLLKAEMTAFRRANADLAWYTEIYRKYATLPKANEATPESLKPLWEGLSQTVKAWPHTLELKYEFWHDLLPVYRQADAIAGTIKVEQVVEPSLTQQAVSELGV
jgi:NitT/TauT family transport system substrate-binding protein